MAGQSARPYHRCVSSECRQQAFIDAPLDLVWALASDPDRQTEWWPDTITFECIDGDFEQGCHVRNVQKRPWPMSELETTLEVDRMVPGKELTIRCMDTGTYTRSVLTEGQGGTFVEMEAGNDPTNSRCGCRSRWRDSASSAAGSSTRWRSSAARRRAARLPGDGRSWIGVIALVIGIYNTVGGIATIAKDDRAEAVTKVLLDIDISVWGWIWLVLGVVQILIGGLIRPRHPTGLVLGVTWATISAALTVFVIFVYPIWALIILGVDILIIWGLIENADDSADPWPRIKRSPGAPPRQLPGWAGGNFQAGRLYTTALAAVRAYGRD